MAKFILIDQLGAKSYLSSNEWENNYVDGFGGCQEKIWWKADSQGKEVIPGLQDAN